MVGPDHDVTLQDINNMPYLDQVLKETLRWFRTVPFILRKTAKDIKISKLYLFSSIRLSQLVQFKMFVNFTV